MLSIQSRTRSSTSTIPSHTLRLLAYVLKHLYHPTLSMHIARVRAQVPLTSLFIKSHCSRTRSNTSTIPLHQLTLLAYALKHLYHPTSRAHIARVYVHGHTPRPSHLKNSHCSRTRSRTSTIPPHALTCECNTLLAYAVKHL